jgi:hypothetical protein
VRRRQPEVFSLSFLDVICCGFGAVILFYTIISAQSGIERIRKSDDLLAEVSLLDEQVKRGTKNLVELKNTLEKTQSETISAASRATRMIETLKASRDTGASDEQATLAARERVEKLKVDVKSLEEASKRLEASAKEATPRSEFAGQRRVLADRRFITGLRLKGKRILILLDASASMLDEDLVNVIRLRNSAEAARRTALKWQRALSITEWIGSQLPSGSQYQIYTFNVQPKPLLEGTEATWLAASDKAQLAKAMKALNAIVPADGTSLANALRVTRELKLSPDQVVLITDGLPTQGATPPALRRFVDWTGRMRHFEEATRGLNPRTPVDVVLLPMRGDVQAPHRFWMLSRQTGGAFIMPSPDWP